MIEPKVLEVIDAHLVMLVSTGKTSLDPDKLSEAETVVLKEAMSAYVDSWLPHMPGRSLEWHAPHFIAKELAVEIMRIALGLESSAGLEWLPPNGDVTKRQMLGYNAFVPDLLLKLPEGRVMLAREGSVCVYVMVNELLGDEAESLADTKVDEIHTILRFWWD